MVLESNKGKSKSGVAAKPEEKRNVKSGLRKSIAGGANLGRASRSRAGSSDSSESGVSDVGKSSGVTNHLPVSSELLRGAGDLIPDVHPITKLTVDALTSNLNLNLGDKLLTDVVQPTGIDTISPGGSHRLVYLRESNLEIGSVSKISVTGDSACYTATKVGLTLESLLNGFHSKICVSAVGYLPEGNLGGSSKENVLGAISDKLH